MEVSDGGVRRSICRAGRSVVQLRSSTGSGGTPGGTRGHHRPADHAEFRRRSGRCRPGRSARGRGPRRHPRRLHPVRGAGLSRPGIRRRKPARLRAPFRSARDHRLQGAQGPQAAPAREHGRCQQSRRREPHPGRRRPPAALQSRQPAVAHRFVVQAPAGLLLDAACPLDPADRRPDRVRRHAGGLRRSARGDEAAHRGPRGRAFDHDRRAPSSVSATSTRASARLSGRCRRCWCAGCRIPAA